MKPWPGTDGEEPTSWEELYNINLMPFELFLKFGKEMEGPRVLLCFYSLDYSICCAFAFMGSGDILFACLVCFLVHTCVCVSKQRAFESI